ncbi:hypothetical protein TorRG33x02_183730 [Trema orientale]|uniref:Transmembrane protein n=1 Tax=Trema orientale TaxID=63057 RepID=A0A2P5EK50_TREOI|nr:hypothetical protein TorRG33x02_183730 [Trema orientale]
MYKVEMMMSKAPPWAAAGFLMAPAAAPATPQQQQELRFVRDRRYAFHGQIMMLVVFALFSIFIGFVAVYPCLKRLRNADSEHREMEERPGCCFLPPFRKRGNHEVSFRRS